MANVDLQESVLQLTVSEGMDPNSENLILKHKRFNNVKPEAEAEQLLRTAHAFASLQQLPLHQVTRRDVSNIYES